MKLTTTFWSDKVETFDTILYINGKTNEIVAQAHLSDKNQTVNFFKFISKFVKTKQVLKSIEFYQNNNADYWQFATYYKGEITPIKWFDLHINPNLVISHDHAFDTTLIKVNGQNVPFGKFPIGKCYMNKKFPKYRAFNIKSKAYKFIANKVSNS